MAKNHVYSADKAQNLDNKLRKWLQNPHKLLSNYIKKGMHVIDLGCGPGYFTLPLSELVGQSGSVLAIDVQEKMLDKLKRKIKQTQCVNTTIVKNDGYSIGINQQVDFVLAAYVMHELPNQKSWIKQLKQVLHDGGHLLILEPNIIVSQKAFNNMVNELVKAGFELIERPTVRFSKSILVKKGFYENK